MNQKV